MEANKSRSRDSSLDRAVSNSGGENRPSKNNTPRKQRITGKQQQTHTMKTLGPSIFEQQNEWEVRIRCTVSRVIDIRLTNQDFEAELNLEASWLEPLLQFSKDQQTIQVDHERSSMKIGNLFVEGDERKLDTPRLYFRNSVELKKSEDWWKIYGDVDSVPIVCWRWKLQARFQEPMDLVKFPLDSQALSMCLVTSWGSKDPKYVNLVQNLNPSYHSRVSQFAFVRQAEYKLYDNIRYKQMVVQSEESFSNSAYMGLVMSMRVDRLPGFWIWNVAGPLFFITSCAFGSWAQPADELGSRSSITLTVLLTLVASKLIITDRMPNINYLTALDKYIMACFLVDFAVLFESFPASLGHGVSIGDREYRLYLMLAGWTFWTLAIATSYILLSLSIKEMKLKNLEWYSNDDGVWIGPLPTDDKTAGKSLANMIHQVLPFHEEVKRVRVWDPDPANTQLKLNGIVHPVQVHDQVIESGKCKSKFAVAQYSSEAFAKRALRENIKLLKGDSDYSAVKMEKLNRSYYSLLLNDTSARKRSMKIV